jgi:hypothetical protein
MLVNFPLDYANEHCIVVALNSFCNLMHWHESSNKARQIVLVKLHSSARIPHIVVVIAEDEPFACCWAVAVYLLIESKMQQPINTDPLPPRGHTPHPMPSPPLCWLGLGTPPLPRRDWANGQQGSGSCVRDHAYHMVREVQRSHQAVHVPVNPVVLGPMIFRRVVTGPTRPPSTMVRLNFEIFVDIY